MSIETAAWILRALGHSMDCPFSGCTCNAAREAPLLYAEASKVLRASRTGGAE